MRPWLPVIVLWATVCLAPTSIHAQQLSVNDFRPTPAKTARGWWSPTRMSFSLLARQPRLSGLKLISLETSERPNSSTPGPGNPAPAYYSNMPNLRPRDFGFGPSSQNRQFSSVAEEELLSRQSFLSFLQAKYTTWELSLADTRCLTNVHGLSVYPLVQIEYANLPISLYIPPLRGSDRW